MKLIFLLLPIILLEHLNVSNNTLWNIVRVSYGSNNRNHKVINDTLVVFYPKNSYTPSVNPQGGIGFFASPKFIFPCTSLLFGYEVFFDDQFDPVLGGKLPGLFISEGTSKRFMIGATGGNNSKTSSSIRIAWRRNMDAEVYLYLPNKQDKTYKDIEGFNENAEYGDSLWRGVFQFKRNTWNPILIRVYLNTVNKTNGILEVTINNITKSFDKIYFREFNNMFLTAILFQTCFGGSNFKYATPKDQNIMFRNIKIAKIL